MNSNTRLGGVHSKHIIRLIIITFALLAIPLLLMVFNVPMYDPGSPYLERVNWGLFDFVAMGFLIFGTGLAYELLKEKAGSRINRMALMIVILGLFFAVWAELAVGIFGTPFAGN